MTDRFTEKLKRSTEAASGEWKSLELYSKSRDEYAKLILGYLFILSSGSVASLAYFSGATNNNRFIFEISHLKYLFTCFSLSILFSLLSLFFAWFNFFAAANMQQDYYNRSIINNYRIEFEYKGEDASKAEADALKATQNAEFWEKWLTPSLLFSILSALVCVLNLIIGWLGILNFKYH